MSERRYNELLSLLIEGDGAAQDFAELLEILQTCPARMADFRKELATSELLAQNFAANRSAEAFQQAWEMRFEAERSGPEFLADFQKRVSRFPKPRRLNWAKWAWAGLAAAACLIAAIGILKFLPGEKPIACLDRISGDVSIHREGNPVTPGHGGEIFSGDELHVSHSASLRIALGDGSEIVLGAQSFAVLRDTKGGLRVDLKSGSLRGDIQPQRAARPLTIQTPHCDVQVLGTTFSVQVDPLNSAVSVSKGKVLCRQNDAEIPVPAGESLLAKAKKLHPLGVVSPLQLNALKGPVAYSQDFEGDASHIINFKPVTDHLPPGSKCATALGPHRAEPEKFPLHRGIHIGDDKEKSLFTYRKGQTFHITFKCDRPTLLAPSVYLVDGKKNSHWRAAYILQRDESWKPGVWQTISIPFEEFQKPGHSQDDKPRFLPDEWDSKNCYNLSVVTYKPIGLIVDRVWITGKK